MRTAVSLPTDYGDVARGLIFLDRNRLGRALLGRFSALFFELRGDRIEQHLCLVAHVDFKDFGAIIRASERSGAKILIDDDFHFHSPMVSIGIEKNPKGVQ